MFFFLKKVFCPLLLVLAAALLFAGCGGNNVDAGAYVAPKATEDSMELHVTGLVANGYIKDGTTVKLEDIIANIVYAPAGGEYDTWRPDSRTDVLTVSVTPAEGTVLTDGHEDVTITATYDDGTVHFTRTHTIPVGEEHAVYQQNLSGIRQINVSVPAADYNVRYHLDKINWDAPLNSESWGRTASIELVVSLAGDSYDQRITLVQEYNGTVSTLWEDTVYNLAVIPVKLQPGINQFTVYMNLEDDGSSADAAVFPIAHQLTVPNVLWNHWTGSYTTLSNYGIDANEESVEGTTFSSGMTFAAEIYYRTADGGYGERIGLMDDSEAQEDFPLPLGVRYEDIVVKLLLAKPLNRVPDVVGLSLGDAISTLNALGYGYQITTCEDSAPANTVIAQQDAGAEKEAGHLVPLTVSTGPTSTGGSAGVPSGDPSGDPTDRPLSNDAALASLVVASANSTGYLNFAPDTLEYYVELDSSPVSITATANDPAATVTGTGVAVPAAGTWTTYTVTVTAADGVTTRSYTIHIWV